MEEKKEKTVAEIWWSERIKRIQSVIENELGAKSFVLAFTRPDGGLFTHCQGELPMLLCCMSAIGADLYRGVTAVQQRVADQQKQTQEPTPEGEQKND